MKLYKIFNCRRTMAMVFGLALLPFVLWGCVLVVAPTGWARSRLVHEIEASTGRKATIGAIRLGVLGNLRISNVELSETETPDDPWLKIAEASLDVHLIQMIGGCCRPTDISLTGLDLRVHRRADGTLEFGTLFGNDSSSQEPTTATSSSTSQRQVNLTIAGARVVIQDESSGTQVEIAGADGHATWTGDVATIESLQGQLNGGSFEFAGRYDRSRSTPAFTAEMRARQVSLGVGMKSLGLLVPVVTNVVDSADGRIDLNLALTGQGGSMENFKSGIKGNGSIRLDPIDLSSSKVLDSIDVLHQIPRSNRVGSVDSHFAIGGGKVATDDLTIRVGRLPITLVGWTDFDGHLDYEVKTDTVRDRLPSEARAILGDLKQELGDLASIRITGTVDAPQLVTGATGRPISKDQERARLREAARKLGERYLR